jgi:hypothetical protein
MPTHLCSNIKKILKNCFFQLLLMHSKLIKTTNFLLPKNKRVNNNSLTYKIILVLKQNCSKLLKSINSVKLDLKMTLI